MTLTCHTVNCLDLCCNKLNTSVQNTLHSTFVFDRVAEDAGRISKVLFCKRFSLVLNFLKVLTRAKASMAMERQDAAAQASQRRSLDWMLPSTGKCHTLPLSVDVCFKPALLSRLSANKTPRKQRHSVYQFRGGNSSRLSASLQVL